MSWLATRSTCDTLVVYHDTGGPDAAQGDDLLVSGSLCIDILNDESHSPAPLLHLCQGGEWPLDICLSRTASGGFRLKIQQPGISISQEVAPRSASQPNAPSKVGLPTPPTGPARLVYAWHGPARWGRLALLGHTGHTISVAEVNAPPPLRLSDLRRLLRDLPSDARQQGLLSVSLSNRILPLAPFAGLAPETLVATPSGPTQISQLKRGDLILSETGDYIPVLHKLMRQRPAVGHDTPVRLRAPFLGLDEDITVAPYQQLVVTGSDVDYLFGRPQVRVPAIALKGTAIASPVSADLTEQAVFTQLVLPRNERFLAAGTPVESLFLGRLRRDTVGLSASAVAHIPRSDLPEHATDPTPILRSFDAAVLAERRIA